MNQYQSNITAYSFGPDREPRAISLPHLASDVSSEKSLVWVDFSDYTTKDLQQAAECLHLPPAAVHATLYGWQRPQLEVFDEQFFLIVTLPKRDTRSSRIQVQHLYLFIGHNFVVSAHEKPLPFFERVLRRAMHTSSLLSLDPVFMLSLILNELVASYEDLDEQLQQEIEELQQRAFTDSSDTNLRDLYHFKRYAFAMSQLINQHQDVFAALLRSDICSMSGQQVEVSYCNLEARLFRLADVLFTARDWAYRSFPEGENWKITSSVVHRQQDSYT